MPSKLADNLNTIREQNRNRKVQFIVNWRNEIPAGSQWFPGSTGKPTCEVCHGLGWLRTELPVGHPDFGKLVPCDCAPKQRKINFRNDD